MTEIWEYIRDKKNRKVGILYANSDEKNVRISFSKCHTMYDEFDPELGFKIARDRSVKTPENVPKKYNIPFSVQDKLPKFIDRCSRYFKDKKMPKWTKKWAK